MEVEIKRDRGKKNRNIKRKKGGDGFKGKGEVGNRQGKGQNTQNRTRADQTVPGKTCHVDSPRR